MTLSDAAYSNGKILHGLLGHLDITAARQVPHPRFQPASGNLNGLRTFGPLHYNADKPSYSREWGKYAIGRELVYSCAGIVLS